MRWNIVKNLLCAVLVIAQEEAGKDAPVPPMMLLPNTGGASGVISSHIISGTLAKVNQFPYQASLFITRPTGTFLCGGSLIHAQYVLTAAHCTDQATEIRVRVGNLKKFDGGYEFVSTTFFQHEMYDRVTLNHDISVIKLPSSAPLSPTNKNVKVIKLLAKNAACPTTLRKLQVSGWGKTSDAGSTSDDLMWTKVNEITNWECMQTFSYRTIADSTICCKGSPDQSTCSGDSGGPLTTSTGAIVQVGVVSFVSASGCSLGKPSGYVRVTHYLDWMRAVTGVTF